MSGITLQMRVSLLQRTGSMLSRIDAVAGGVMQIACFVSVSILLKLIPKCNRLIPVQPGKYEQLKWCVNLVMLFFKQAIHYCR